MQISSVALTGDLNDLVLMSFLSQRVKIYQWWRLKPGDRMKQSRLERPGEKKSDQSTMKGKGMRSQHRKEDTPPSTSILINEENDSQIRSLALIGWSFLASFVIFLIYVWLIHSVLLIISILFSLSFVRLSVAILRTTNMTAMCIVTFRHSPPWCCPTFCLSCHFPWVRVVLSFVHG